METENLENIPAGLEVVKARIAEAEQKSGRAPGSVKLLAVSKFHPVEAVLAAYNAGQRLFGENRVQEASEKFIDLGMRLRLKGLSFPELHLIGSLQRNKARQAIAVASCIQSVDRVSLLEELAKLTSATGKKIKVLFEYHTGEEAKSGFENLEDLLFALEAAIKMPYIVPSGFMTMAPFTDNESEIRRSFSLLREIAEKARKRFSNFPLFELSMGMSNDYRIAIEEGSTLVRIGTAIFGERQ
jgi:pyridoxal phosphate enzyme (YggS family)